LPSTSVESLAPLSCIVIPRRWRVVRLPGLRSDLIADPIPYFFARGSHSGRSSRAASTLGSCLVTGGGPDEFKKATSDSRAADSVIGLYEFDGVGLPQRVLQLLSGSLMD
jgi:hypothetical protein